MREPIRFNNVGLFLFQWLPFFVMELLPEIAVLLRYDPRLREEIILVWEGSLHLHQVARQVVFSGKHINSRILIDLLIGRHLGQEVSRNAQVVPGKVPIR